MRTLFRDHTSDLSGALSDSEIDALFDRAYQYRIPAEVGGSTSKGTWSLTCVANTGNYAFPDYVFAPTAKGVNIVSTATGGNLSTIHWIDAETRDEVWSRDDRIFPPTTGMPTSVLFYNRMAFFSPAPDLDYIVNIPARMGPSTGVPTTGIGDDNHAMCVVTSAASEFLLRIGNRESAADQSDLFSYFVELMQVKSNAQPHHRRQRVSF